jgi:hypothetical protein
MNLKIKRILIASILLLPVLIAGLITKNVTLDILPILVVAGFAFWVAVSAKHTEKGKL